MLTCENFSFSFGEGMVLEKINFSLTKGAYLSVIGPNGAGKSTLLKCLLRLHEQGSSQGEIFVKGQPLFSYKQRHLAKIISYVPQAGGWIPPFTVREFLRMSRYPHSVGKKSFAAADEEALERALNLTGLEPLAERFLRSLSGGERQKAFLAAALAQESEIMLLDEPTAFLDPKHGAELNWLLKSLNREQGLTMIGVTHDLNHPLDAGGEVLVLRQGQQFFFGPPAELLENSILEEAYRHTFTRFAHPVTGRPLVLADQP